jgi:hypothetical protein
MEITAKVRLRNDGAMLKDDETQTTKTKWVASLVKGLTVSRVLPFCSCQLERVRSIDCGEAKTATVRFYVFSFLKKREKSPLFFYTQFHHRFDCQRLFLSTTTLSLF